MKQNKKSLISFKLALMAICLSFVTVCVLANLYFSNANYANPSKEKLPANSLKDFQKPINKAKTVFIKRKLSDNDIKLAKKNMRDWINKGEANSVEKIVVFIEKINRAERSFFRKNKTLLLPVNLTTVYSYKPLEEKQKKFSYNKLIFVDLSKQCFGAYENGRLVNWGPISSGKGGHKTKPGDFQVNFKHLNHFSSIYRCKMNFALNINGNIFLHQGILPGWADSHGCVRLLKIDAKYLYNWAEIGTKVVLVDGKKELKI